eukprot:1159197-Pelagomonas_calceolata.AAC.4
MTTSTLVLSRHCAGVEIANRGQIRFVKRGPDVTGITLTISYEVPDILVSSIPIFIAVSQVSQAARKIGELMLQDNLSRLSKTGAKLNQASAVFGHKLGMRTCSAYFLGMPCQVEGPGVSVRVHGARSKLGATQNKDTGTVLHSALRQHKLAFLLTNSNPAG